MPEILADLDDRIARLRSKQLALWEDGRRVLLEELVKDEPSLDDETLLDLIYAEVLLREQFGEAVASTDYERRFPHLQVAIARQLYMHAALAGLETPRPASPALAETLRLSGDPASATDVSIAPRKAGEKALPAAIGPYDIHEELGRGGTGVVYRGRHRLLSNRIAAIKVLRPGSASAADDRARFETEARAVADLHHPNIVPIYELGTYEQQGEDCLFVALEFVDGGSLARAIDGTPLPADRAVELMIPLTDAVAHAHSRGIVHRDLKPANILLAQSEIGGPKAGEDPENLSACLGHGISNLTPKVTDFGLAKRLDVDSHQTQTGAILGTPSYMAPEQATGRSALIGPACDVYALGAILYEMLTGRPPFRAETILQTLQLVTHREPVPPRALNPNVPRDLETICLKCLQKEPGRRYASASALGDDLRRHRAGEPILARPAGMTERMLKWIRRRPAAAALLTVSAAALAGLVVLWTFFTVRLHDEKLAAQHQRDEARRQKEHADEQESVAKAEAKTARQQSERAAQLLTLAAASVDDIAMSVRAAKGEELETRNTGSVLFSLACSYARTSATLRREDHLLLDDRSRLAEQYAISAVRLLKCANQIKFFARSDNRRALDHNPDLACLRERKDYRDFLATVQAP